MLLRRYGSTAGFVRQKQEGLSWYYQELRSLQAEARCCVVFETTGLSDRTHLLRLMEARPCVLALVDASRELCVRRVAGRPKGQNFSNEGAGQFHDFWTQRVKGQYQYDLVLDNDGAPEDVLVGQVAQVVPRTLRSL